MNQNPGQKHDENPGQKHDENPGQKHDENRGQKPRGRGRRASVAVLAGLFTALVSWTVWGNLTISVTHIEGSCDAIPAGFDGFTIAQVSDLHNAQFGDGNERLLTPLRAASPDAIVITGDMVDMRNTDVSVAADFARQAARIAPSYYVTGNHEAWLGSDYEDLELQLREAGVTILRNDAVSLSYGGDEIVLIGVDDPEFAEGNGYAGARDVEEHLSALVPNNGYTVLLSHRPELFETYVGQGINLVFSGHAHGGQVRLPFVGGLFAPHQGLFPEYDAGPYHEEGTTMIVSRGLGNSVVPVRINNRPELVIVTLKSGS